MCQPLPIVLTPTCVRRTDIQTEDESADSVYTAPATCPTFSGRRDARTRRRSPLSMLKVVRSRSSTCLGEPDKFGI